MIALLRRYIAEVVADPRVPNQLLSKDDGSEDNDEDDEVDEECGAGAVAGFTGPLGASSEDLGGGWGTGKKTSARQK